MRMEKYRKEWEEKRSSSSGAVKRSSSPGQLLLRSWLLWRLDRLKLSATLAQHGRRVQMSNV